MLSTDRAVWIERTRNPDATNPQGFLAGQLVLTALRAGRRSESRRVSVEASDEQQVGYLATRSILAARPWPTAIASGNDRVAHGVYEALRDFGISPGREISVAGFNDTLEAVILHPTLTTVRVFPEQIGRKLAEQIISRIENADTAPERVVIPTQLIRRESCLALRVSNGAA